MILVRSALRPRVIAEIQSSLEFYLAKPHLWFGIEDLWEPQLTANYDSRSISIVDLGSGLTQMVVNEVYRIVPQLSLSSLSKPLRYRSQFCQFAQGSGMNSHRDSRYIWAATVYLNRQWDRLSGGWFCCDDFLHVPEYNSLVINTQHQSHAVSQVYSSQPRLTQQIWAYS